MANPITLHTPTAEEAPLQDKLNDALVRELLHRTKSASVALLLATLGGDRAVVADAAGVGSGASFLLALPFGTTS